MGKKRARSQPASSRAPLHDSSDEELIRGELDEDELRDELDEFELARERALLARGASNGKSTRADIGGRSGIKNVKGGKEMEVLAFDDDDSGSDDEYQDGGVLGRLEGEDEDDGAAAAEDEPSSAWGRRKGAYYSADYVDEDWRGATREETLEAAELEEREARAIQRRLAAHLEQDQLEFGLAAVQQPAPELPADGSEVVQRDTSRLTAAERRDLLKRECPELLPLVEEFRSRWSELTDRIAPLYRLAEEGRLAAGPGADYVRVRHRLLLLYCLNISSYLGLRAARRATARHPVLARIAQYGKLIHMMAAPDQSVEEDVERVLNMVKEGVQFQVLTGTAANTDSETSRPSKKLRVGKRRGATKSGTASSAVDHKLAALTMEINALEEEKKRLATEKEAAGPSFTERRQAGQVKHNPLTPFRRKDRPSSLVGQEGDEEQEEGLAEGQKRSITYQIAKNKGLMPKRSRESRNPRVKHKEKFKRAVKKRRSMVRLPKKEIQKYGGEVFGIRMGAVKSVQIR